MSGDTLMVGMACGKEGATPAASTHSRGMIDIRTKLATFVVAEGAAFESEGCWKRNQQCQHRSRVIPSTKLSKNPDSW